MMTEPADPGRSRLAARGPKVRAAVLAAALAELAGTGYAALTVENVARRAGVHKTTIYRRWPDREALVADAVTSLATARIPFPDTGDIGTDLRRFARSLVAWLNSPLGKAANAAQQSDAARIPAVANARRRFLGDRLQRAAPVITGAIERGELPAGTDPAQLVSTVIAPIYLRLLVTAEPIDKSTADSAVRVALAAARAGALTAGRRGPGRAGPRP
jgi:AcrR family transcriptional regulator